MRCPESQFIHKLSNELIICYEKNDQRKLAITQVEKIINDKNYVDCLATKEKLALKQKLRELEASTSL